MTLFLLIIVYTESREQTSLQCELALHEPRLVRSSTTIRQHSGSNTEYIKVLMGLKFHGNFRS